MIGERYQVIFRIVGCGFHVTGNLFNTLLGFYYMPIATDCSKIHGCFVLSFVEMVESMKQVAKLNEELSVEERNLLSVAYKNVIGARRASWRIISSIETKEESKDSKSGRLEEIREYRKQVQHTDIAISYLRCIMPTNSYCNLPTD